MVATDGITFRSRHPNLHISPEELGAWEESEHRNLTLFMPGIYWDDNTRDKLRNGGDPSLKSRGIPAKALASRIFDIDDNFRRGGSGIDFPAFEIPISFAIISPKQALARGKWELCGRVSTDSTRQIDSDPYTKRNPILELDGDIWRSGVYNLDEDVIETTP
jgi:hypothetical protein